DDAVDAVDEEVVGASDEEAAASPTDDEAVDAPVGDVARDEDAPAEGTAAETAGADAGGTADPADGDGSDGDVNELDVPRRGRTALAVSVIVAVLAVAFVWVLATREPGTDRQASSELIGRAAPAVRGRTL